MMRFFSSALAAPDPERVLAEMRENVLELKPERSQMIWSAPAAPGQQNAGSASDLEVRIDIAPVIAARTDSYQQMRNILRNAQPTGLLKVYRTRAPKDQMFAAIDRALVLQSITSWNAAALETAISAAIRPGLTASEMGVEWVEKTGTTGNYAALDGQVQMFLAVRDTRLFLATNEALLQALLATSQEAPRSSASGITYAATFLHSPREQQVFRKIVNRLDSAGAGKQNSQDSDADAQGNGKTPAFLSGNIASLSRTFADVVSESIEEKDQGELVMQTVVYQWKRP